MKGNDSSNNIGRNLFVNILYSSDTLLKTIKTTKIIPLSQLENYKHRHILKFKTYDLTDNIFTQLSLLLSNCWLIKNPCQIIITKGRQSLKLNRGRGLLPHPAISSTPSS
jgi:hypothetical protein